MLSARISVIARGKVIKQLDVGHEPAVGVIPLDQVVAEDLIFGERVAVAASNASRS